MRHDVRGEHCAELCVFLALFEPCLFFLYVTLKLPYGFIGSVHSIADKTDLTRAIADDPRLGVLCLYLICGTLAPARTESHYRRVGRQGLAPSAFILA